MRGLRFAVLACVVICAFALGGFVQSAWAVKVQTPAKVVLTPKNPSVIIGETQTFTAKVLDKAGNKMKTPVLLTWSLADSALTAGCTIDQDGVVTVPDTAAVGTFAKAVTAAVTFARSKRWRRKNSPISPRRLSARAKPGIGAKLRRLLPC